jgi:hypothetical protein
MKKAGIACQVIPAFYQVSSSGVSFTSGGSGAGAGAFW